MGGPVSADSGCMYCVCLACECALRLFAARHSHFPALDHRVPLHDTGGHKYQRWTACIAENVCAACSPEPCTSMTTIDDLPAPVVRLITRLARTRHIPGTNRFARICRSWRDAAQDSDEQEQLLLALEGLPPDTVTSTSAWLAQHGTCVDALYISYKPTTAALFQQLPLATSPLVGLARLEVDGPDSLVSLAPALPQLVALTHLGASINMDPRVSSEPNWSEGVFSTAQGVLLDTPPCLQQLCPGLKSLRLDITYDDLDRHELMAAPVTQLLPDHLEQLHIHSGGRMVLHCGPLTRYTSLGCLTLAGMVAVDPDRLLLMPALKALDLHEVGVWTGRWQPDGEVWLTSGLCTAPQHLTKLTWLYVFGLAPGVLTSATLRTALSGLRTLYVQVWERDDAARVQQLSSLRHLQHLSLYIHVGARNAEPVLSALSSVQQLTCLGLDGVGGVERDTWEEVLPHLTQLRVLGVTRGMLDDGLAAELPHLTRLQNLYVHLYSGDCAPRGWRWGACGGVARHLQVLSTCSSLRAVLCWRFEDGLYPAACPVWEYVHEGRLHLSCWSRWRAAAEEGRVVCPRACPHLPGVWELQQDPVDDLRLD